MTSRDTYDIHQNEIEEIVSRLKQIALWHAKEQIKFYQELESDEENV